MNQRTEVLISGGGFAGVALAIALAESRIGVTVVEAMPAAAATAPAFDGRVCALAPDVVRMLVALGVWSHVAEAEPVHQIVVSGGRPGGAASPFFLHFDENDTGEPLFHVVENRFTRLALLKRAAEMTNLTIMAPARIDRAAASAGAIEAELSNGDRISARALVAAEGRDSPLRNLFGIKVSGWSYGQRAIVCTIEHERPHEGIAQDLFLPSGPFGILPMTGNRSSIVWAERDEQARTVLALDDEAFAAALRERFTDYLGEARPVGPRWSYPLGTQLARDYVAPRFALIGDAAHIVHPLAGQGLNLGLRDVAALAEAMVDADRLGLDIGGTTTLEAYQRRRRIDATAMGALTDGLNRLFSNDNVPLRSIREAGLGAVNAIDPLRRFFARAAAGAGLGEAPRLLKGEAL